MTENPQNPPPPLPHAPLSPSDERTWAMLSHLSILLNLATGFLGTVAALVIYIVFKDRSHYVGYQSLQAFWFQVVAWIGGGIVAGILWTIGGILSAICIGVLIFPLAILFSLLPVAALVYGVVGAIQTSQGGDFRYWLVGDWVRGTLSI
ncbi:MAG: DUF4870 domain-containing protein [Chloroflexi bacterium]|nr:DUF4870 domain-containing protein [Chloroflexota bacterium]